MLYVPTAGKGSCQPELVLLCHFYSCRLFLTTPDNWAQINSTGGAVSANNIHGYSVHCFHLWPQPVNLQVYWAAAQGCWGWMLGLIDSASKPSPACVVNCSLFAQRAAGALRKGPGYYYNINGNSNKVSFLVPSCCSFCGFSLQTFQGKRAVFCTLKPSVY